LLKSGKARNGKGKEINNKELLGIYNEITQVRASWRSEWLDAKFEQKEGVWKINYNHSIDNGNLKPDREENLEECPMKDKWKGIDMNDWISNATDQGLPSPQIKDGNLYY